MEVKEEHRIEMVLDRDEYQAMMTFFSKGTMNNITGFLDTLNPENPIHIDISREQAILVNNIIRQIVTNYKKPDFLRV